jgi:hypothetical protein
VPIHGRRLPLLSKKIIKNIAYTGLTLHIQCLYCIYSVAVAYTYLGRVLLMAVTPNYPIRLPLDLREELHAKIPPGERSAFIISAIRAKLAHKARGAKSREKAKEHD